MNFLTSAGGILFSLDLKRVYLIKKIARNEWTLPKGHLEEGETPIDTAKREIHEETGLSNFIIMGNSPCNTVKYLFEDENGTNEKTVYFYSVIVLDDKITPTKEMEVEGLAGGWFDFQDALNITSLASVKETIIKAYELTKGLCY